MTGEFGQHARPGAVNQRRNGHMFALRRGGQSLRGCCIKSQPQFCSGTLIASTGGKHSWLRSTQGFPPCRQWTRGLPHRQQRGQGINHNQILIRVHQSEEVPDQQRSRPAVGHDVVEHHVNDVTLRSISVGSVHLLHTQPGQRASRHIERAQHIGLGKRLIVAGVQLQRGINSGHNRPISIPGEIRPQNRVTVRQPRPRLQHTLRIQRAIQRERHPGQIRSNSRVVLLLQVEHAFLRGGHRQGIGLCMRIDAACIPTLCTNLAFQCGQEFLLQLLCGLLRNQPRAANKRHLD